MKRILIAATFLLALLCIGLSFASAQHSLTIASVPRAPSGCTSTFACPPTSQPGGAHSGDEDGDGIPDGIDQCPNDSGPSSNQGCPVGRSLSASSGDPITVGTPSIASILLPILPTSKSVCALATKTNVPVNIHSQPSTHAPVIGTLDPNQTYLPDSALILLDGSKWIALNNPYGWVAATAVRLSAGCPYTLATYKQRPPNPSPQPITSMGGYGITLDKGSSAGQDTAQGYCSSSFALTFSKLDGTGNAVHFEFGDSSNPLSLGCIMLDSDGQGFDLFPPCTTGQVALACSKFVLHGSFGMEDGQMVFLVTFQPAPSNGEPPPDPDKQGFFFSWALEPPDPCDTADQSCTAQHGAKSFAIDWSQPSDSLPGMAFAWNFAPPDPCTPADTSCKAPGEQTQGVLINFLPAVQTTANPGAPNTIAAYFFPNGFGRNFSGFTLFENQPGGSQPGDQYGFTLIENQPAAGQELNFSLPAVQ